MEKWYYSITFRLPVSLASIPFVDSQNVAMTAVTHVVIEFAIPANEGYS